MYKVKIYDLNGMFRMEVKFNTLEECKMLWECFPQYTKPTVWKMDENKVWVRLLGY